MIATGKTFGMLTLSDKSQKPSLQYKLLDKNLYIHCIIAIITLFFHAA